MKDRELRARVDELVRRHDTHQHGFDCGHGACAVCNKVAHIGYDSIALPRPIGEVCDLVVHHDCFKGSGHDRRRRETLPSGSSTASCSSYSGESAAPERRQKDLKEK